MTLDGEDVEAIARRVAELLRTEAPASAQYVDASTIARHFGVTRAWVYQHKTELGAVALGTGPKPRLRFDAARVAQVVGSEREPSPARRRARPGTRRRARTPTGLPVLEYEGM